MLNLLWLVPACPLLGFLVLFGTEGKLSKNRVPWIGAGSVGVSALLSAGIGVDFLAHNPDQSVFRQMLWSWVAVSDFKVDFALYLDALSLNMMLVVTGVGFLIHVYSAGYMADDPGYSRFFACMNLFVFAMLMLVLADNLGLLFLGWEGVGLCSYLLIGFWYDKAENGHAARKAFIVTRAGDTAMALGLFLLFTQLGSLDIQTAMAKAVAGWPPGSSYAVAASLLLLGGAVGKSAQLPLQVWLPDAMAGPIPVSALIHAATMVTAGVYLIARTHELFALVPDVQLLVAAIGAITLLLAGFAALAQTDIKRILAYSTISQIGYMFLALGVGAWSSAIFHLMTHAVFKALLFLAAGAVILSMHHEQNIFNMGGLWKRLPVTFWTFLIGAAALVALPFTSGYYSKHEILLAVYAAGSHGPRLWAAGIAGALLTALYSARLILVAFLGPEHGQVKEDLPATITMPLVLLALLAMFGGRLKMPLVPALDCSEPESTVVWITALMPWVGIFAAYLIYGRGAGFIKRLNENAIVSALQRFCFNGCGFDALYSRLLVQPFLWLAAVNKRDVIDTFYRDLVALVMAGHRLLALTQNGRLRWYAAAMVCGVVAGLTWGMRP
ncbi:NADH-quinone oxidoreductase subunit L [Candidatus Methylospira mobilis]|uniref:NADH-quinone oxidoreductase subunit L n=1 Tax=Candidatus Methylospira mobilis TaxID=1808979 RepID=UPI0028E8F557|nr:NADH-quinone oxidoreductase subunit L [Candidatus Methylospira mobilis]WNV02925.1 NADH-quinone oxidoreductase subunit L [Candidatus Methylospira mobilis]